MNPVCRQVLSWRAVWSLVVPNRSPLAKGANEAGCGAEPQWQSQSAVNSEPCASTDYSMVIPKPSGFSGASLTQTNAGPYLLLHDSLGHSWLAKVTGVSHNILHQSGKAGLFDPRRHQRRLLRTAISPTSKIGGRKKGSGTMVAVASARSPPSPNEFTSVSRTVWN